MHRIDDEALANIVAVAVRTAPATVKQGLRSRRPVVRDQAIGQLARHVARQLSNDSTMVIRTELVDNIGCNGRPGIWGMDEPDPTVD